MCDSGVLPPKRILRKLQKFGLKPHELAIVVKISEQKLYLVRDGEIVKTYPVSTSKYGVGNQKGSNRTPLGTHRIFKKIGDGAKIGAIFEHNVDTGRVATIHTDETQSGEDLITTRIMWLEGLEPGINRGEGIDSRDRHIYIHGTPEEWLIGRPASHGCIRMKNRDVVELFNLVREGTLVEIVE